MKKNSIKTIAIFILTTMLFAACESTSKQSTLSDDASPVEIIQAAQNAVEDSNTKLAKQYYTMLLQRYGMNTEYYIEGRFELAHLYLKEKNYERAVPMLEEILEIYNTSPYGSLPGAFRRLAEIDLAKVPEKNMNLIKAQRTKDLEDSYNYDDDYYEDESDDYYDDESYSDEDDSYYDESDEYEEDEEYIEADDDDIPSGGFSFF